MKKKKYFLGTSSVFKCWFCHFKTASFPLSAISRRWTCRPFTAQLLLIVAAFLSLQKQSHEVLLQANSRGGSQFCPYDEAFWQERSLCSIEEAWKIWAYYPCSDRMLLLSSFNLSTISQDSVSTVCRSHHFQQTQPRLCNEHHPPKTFFHEHRLPKDLSQSSLSSSAKTRWMSQPLRSSLRAHWLQRPHAHNQDFCGRW